MLYSGRGSEQCTSLDMLTELMDFVLSAAASLYGNVLDLCPLVGCGLVYICCNISTARQRVGKLFKPVATFVSVTHSLAYFRICLWKL
jgi:hypothetical protein